MGTIRSEQQPPRQPLPDPHLRTGRGVVAALEVDGHRRRPPSSSWSTVPVFQKLGSEFMPPLDEGSLFYMPTTMPGISVTEAQKLLQVTDRIIKEFPGGRPGAREGGTGRDVDGPGALLDARDPRSSSSRKAEWRKVDTWYSSWAPEWLKPVFRRDLARHPLVGGAGRPDERGAEASRPLQRLDHADQGPDRHADDRHPHPRGAQDLRRQPGADRADRGAGGGGPAVR